MNAAHLETLSEEKMAPCIENVLLIEFRTQVSVIKLKSLTLEEQEKELWQIRHTINEERKATEQQKKEMWE